MTLYRQPSFHQKRSDRYNTQSRFQTRGSTGPELKFIDIATATYDCDTTGDTVVMNVLATGTDFNNRIGRKVVFKKIQVRGQFRASNAGIPEQQLLRIMLIYDKQPDTGNPTPALVLQQSNSTSFVNNANTDRFQIIMNKMVTMAAYAAANDSSGGPACLVDEYIECDLVTKYDDTTAAAASIEYGAIWLISIGSVAAGAAAGTFVGSVRLRYIDS